MKIIIPGVPISQTRMKHRVIKNFAHVYDPREKEKKDIRLILQKNFTNFPKFEHPFISFLFHMPILSSTPKKLLPIYHSGLLKHEKKPDVDNFIKLYLDCLDGIAFDGDQKVQLGFSLKLYHQEPKTVIVINETEELLALYELESNSLKNLIFSESDISSSSETPSLLDSDIQAS